MDDKKSSLDRQKPGKLLIFVGTKLGINEKHCAKVESVGKLKSLSWIKEKKQIS